jgi:hypothetical protein
MSITATLVRQIFFPGTDNLWLYRFSIPSVPALTIQPDIIFDLCSPGKFENIRIACMSPNFNFSIRLEPGISPPSIEEIYNVINIDDYDFDDNVDIWWAKPAGPNQDKLYGDIKNNSGTPTGTIFFEFVVVCY